MTTPNQRPVYTVGHSNHSLQVFLDLLKAHAIAELVDVRSFPYSRHTPQFNKSSLQEALRQQGVHYTPLGGTLGGRPLDPKHYNRQGRADYVLMGQAKQFRQAIALLATLAEKQPTAIMCTEKDPANCHRALLIALHLEQTGRPSTHIMPDGSLQTNQELADTLANKFKITQQTPEARMKESFHQQALRSAYRRPH